MAGYGQCLLNIWQLQARHSEKIPELSMSVSMDNEQLLSQESSDNLPSKWGYFYFPFCVFTNLQRANVSPTGLAMKNMSEIFMVILLSSLLSDMTFDTSK